MGGPGAKPLRCRQALDSSLRDHDIMKACAGLLTICMPRELDASDIDRHFASQEAPWMTSGNLLISDDDTAPR
jgi:hypothetical protein